MKMSVTASVRLYEWQILESPKLFEWLTDNVGQRGQTWDIFRNSDHSGVFMFSNEKDATMFALMYK